MERIYVFLLLFSIVYYFEAIGGSYIVSAVQSIERQFQIPSKLSGFMISASDIGYIPTVIFISYVGGKGNRAKWIGAGTVMMAITYLMIASPNFLFPVVRPVYNFSLIKEDIVPTKAQLSSEASLEQLLNYSLIHDYVPLKMRNRLLDLDDNSTTFITELPVFNRSSHGPRGPSYSVDGGIMESAMGTMEEVLRGESSVDDLRAVLLAYVRRRENRTEQDIDHIRRAAVAPFAFCSRLVNNLRNILQESKCTQSAGNFGPFVIIFTALFFLGIGRTMPWSLGMPLIDDNVKRKNMPAYFAGINFIKILGPICGFLIGSFCNKLYYTLNPPAGLTPKDPTWIGAWWLGFLVIGTLTIFPSLMLYFFPNPKSSPESSGTDKPLANGKGQLSMVDKHLKEKNPNRTLGERTKEFIKTYCQVFHSKVYVGSVIGRVLDILAFKGYMVFLPKYLENHYGIPQYRVHQYMAAFGVFGFATGNLSGGLIMRKFKLNGRKAALFVLCVSFLNVALFFSKGFIACESIVNSVGVEGRDTNYNFTKSCNADCGCENARLFPVCDVTGRAFFSPCHAGCRRVKVRNLEEYDLDYDNCECAEGGQVKKDFCQDTCKKPTILFFVTVILGSFLAGNGMVPGLLILLRSVPPASRSLSLGLQGFMVSLFGTLPSPIIWGFVVDSACLVWDKACSGEHGACAIYDPHDLRQRLHFLYAAIRFVSLFTDLYVWYHAKGLNILDEEEAEEVDDIARRESIKLKPVENVQD